MAGIAQVFLTDKELEMLVAWGEAAVDGGEVEFVTDRERHLLGKLRSMANVVSCKTCTTCKGAEGETCAIPQTRAVTPADVATR